MLENADMVAKLQGVIVGILVSMIWYRLHARKARKKWKAERSELKAQLRQLQTDKQLLQEEMQSLQAQFQKQSSKKTENSAPKWEMIPPSPEKKGRKSSLDPAKDPGKTPAARTRPVRQTESAEARIQRICGAFQSVETLELQFQYSFPDNLLLQPGHGYMRNGNNQLLPEKDAFLQANSAKGYAMEGMFYLYDVLYQGKKFSFQQIMEGKMGNAYVRLQEIPEPAQIERTGHYGYYRLARKGIMEVVNVE